MEAPVISASVGCPSDGLALEDGRTGPRVLDHACPSCGKRLSSQLLDGAAVLAVQRDECPMPTSSTHQAHDGAVVDLQAVGVGEIELEGRDPHLYPGRNDRLGHGLCECEM